VRLLIVGPGKLDAASERILGERLLEDVEFLGQVPYDDLPRYYRTADIFCSPATGGESFGIVLLEAMAAGTPVIASDIPGYATVIEDGAHGVLVPPKDDAALANALVEMIRRPDTRRDLGQRGRAYAQAFSWDLVARRVMDYYEQLLQERDPLRRLQKT
jgi:phosphatidylinositol alpha-mannosyltransferase